MDTAAQVLRDVIAELTVEPVLYYARLTIAVRDGTVTILGQGSTLAERTAIERVARRIAGIKALVLEIRTNPVPHIVVDCPIRQ
jgi:osmotically-inducible protein OsmY